MRRFLAFAFSCLSCFLCLLQSGHAAEFILGVLPIHSARVLAERYEPLRTYLEKHLKQPVRLESASGFAHFQARTLGGGFDLTLSPAHFARLAQKDAGYQPLAQFTPDHDALLVTAIERPPALPDALRGRELAVIDRLAITVMAAISDLEDAGLEAGRDYRVVEHRTHASAAYSVVSGLTVAAITTSQGLLQMPKELRDRLLVRKHIADIPAFIFMARPTLPREQAERLKRLLLAFPEQPEGQAFLGQIGYSAVLPVSEAHLRRADTYLKATRKALAP